MTVSSFHRRQTIAAALVVLFGVSSCAPTITHYHNARSGLTQTDFDRDQYQCQRENAVKVLNVNDLGMSWTETDIDDDMVQRCLAARGWRPIPSQQ